MTPLHARYVATLLVTLLSLASAPAQAASVQLRYKLSKGASYQVKQLHHDKGKSVSEIDMMGQKQVIESPLDHVSSSQWNARVISISQGKAKLAMGYGRHQGGQRWAKSTTDSAKLFADSKAEALIDPVKGLVSLTTTPADALTDIVYRSRFGWLPALPRNRLKVGDGFEHDYRYNSEQMSSKRHDEYYLDEVANGLAYFSVESKEIIVHKFQQPDPAQMGGMQGMMPQQGGGSMTITYKGEGTAIFDLKEGMFIEWEVKRAYDMPTSSMMGMTTRMRGVVRERWELERR